MSKEGLFIVDLLTTEKLKNDAPLRDYLLDCLLTFAVGANKIMDADLSSDTKVEHFRVLRNHFGTRERWRDLGLM